MNPESDPQAPESSDGSPPEQLGNGTVSAAGRASVRSGLARRRNPALVFLGDFVGGTRRMLFKDPLSLFLLLASLGLAISFAVLLGDIKPSSAGRHVPPTTRPGRPPA